MTGTFHGKGWYKTWQRWYISLAVVNKYESFIDELLDEAKRYMIIVNPLETDFNRRIEKNGCKKV